ncbi:hypothetical protein PP175_25335 (plasmid) [Aneurinibacillus sp. Ricciae_BoGa-3]|uniref:hypothetical protein n=1 Tax=Aneurinibacillus sp. Ricciae_BoGa-3 TaxID=3022697 RepID=UPI002341752B|nr:hypothetical protein [Aneurinibacillus sp. Ricciae_BoGa-3]WCK57393.1 hypothetical protein PP175_25335 [Aneurinibacillus sp. Ricciae_BoGa-3]
MQDNKRNVKIGDTVLFQTGNRFKVVPDGQAVLYVDKDKITISDVQFYLENDACHVVSE